MFDFITDEHKMIQQAARDFAQGSIAPIAEEIDRSGQFPMKTIKEMGKLGFMGIQVPEKYGGADMDTLAYVLVMIEVSKVCATHGVIMSLTNSLFSHIFLNFATEEQRMTHYKPVVEGEMIGAFSLSEPQSGSDASNMQSTAVLNEAGTHYVINGTKSWVTSGPVADRILLFTRTDPSAGKRGISTFIIEGDKPGLTRGKPEDKLGIRGSGTCEIYFDNYHCPVENRIGEEGQGFEIAMSGLDTGRIGIASQALGIAEAALEASIDYTKEREAFGQKIGQFQMIQQKLADMKTRVEASRMLIYRAALAREHAIKNGGGRTSLDTSMAKLFASETAMFVTTEAIQIHGGMGYTKEMPLERHFRDAKITEIYEGTSEIQRLVIARSLTGLR